MGIPRGTARLLLEEHRRRPFSGSLLQLGRSTVYFTGAELEEWAGLHDVELAPVDEEGLSHDPRLARQGCLDDVTLYRRLGFDTVEASDVSDWEGADHILDLNRPLDEQGLAHLAGRYDVVLDPGTLVQVFHVPNVLANIHRLVAPGGRVVHAAIPSNNHVDLGFYMVSPTLFADFYGANGWQVDSVYLCVYRPWWHRGRLHSDAWKVYRYTTGALDHLSFGRFGGRQAAVFAVATKSEGATGDVVPVLGQYAESWKLYEAARSGEAGERAEIAAGQREVEGDGPGGGGLARRAERFLERHPRLDRAYLPVKRIKERLVRRLPQRMPPLVGRF